MLNVIYSGRFKKDYKKCIKRGLDVSLLKSVVNILSTPASLPIKNQDHDLKGCYMESRKNRPQNRDGAKRAHIRQVKIHLLWPVTKD